MKAVLYADDTVFIVSSKNVIELIKLVTVQFTLHSVWFSDNLLALNAAKTNFILFAPKFLAANCPNVLNFDVHDVVKVNIVYYFGQVIACEPAWKQRVQCVNDKIVKGLAIVKICSFMPLSCLHQLYYAFIYPYLYYGIALWGISDKQNLYPILVLQKRAIRLIVLAGAHEHCLPIAKTLGTLLIKDSYKYRILCLMSHIFHNNCPTTFNCMFTKLNSFGNYCTRYCLTNFFVHKCNTNFKKYFISHQGVVQWNALPQTN